MNEENFRKYEIEVIGGLKNFQRATVERIDQLFRQGRNRVLVADEVGLGKTLIARGCIAKTGVLRTQEGDNLFKIVYVCSNQNIARKNILKLDVYGVGGFDRLSDSRLSMQHLRIVEQETQCKRVGREVQLIPLTPQTSFSMTSGGGTVDERALMFQILRLLPELQAHEAELENMLIYRGAGSWEYSKRRFGERVDAMAKATAASDNPYPQSVVSEISEKYADRIAELVNTIIEKKTIDSKLLNRLRTMFALISVGRLQPDLVIMDEFQRFRSLLSDNKSEMGIIAHEFLNRPDTRILLLSATPYKLYSTLEEIEEKQGEDHYKEFMQVMHFLFPEDGERARFEQVWMNYSDTLHFLNSQLDFETVVVQKEAAETELYRAMCRTERLSVMNGEDFIDSSSVNTPLSVSAEDIRGYVDGCCFIESTNLKNSSLPLDYAKSCPFLLSFMSNYNLMNQLKAYFSKSSERPKRRKGRKDLLWLSTDDINSYHELPRSNARLEMLKDILFNTRHKGVSVGGRNAHMFLWVPPSLPYYPLTGVYKDSKHFSKILIFSAWEMVPKMISSLISYEAERLTVGKMAKLAERRERRNTHYFSTRKGRRYPYPRLVGASEWYLLYPSPWLADLYHPVECLNKRLSLTEIIQHVKSEVAYALRSMEHYIGERSGAADSRWYLVAPMIMDGWEHVGHWLGLFNEIKGKTAVHELLNGLKNGTVDFDNIQLGPQPDDLADMLALMAVGSPVNCIFRSNGRSVDRAVALADVFINRFNTPEATAVVALAGARNSEDSHWQDMLRYCANGCFQAMFDEYHHMLADEVQFSPEEDKEAAIHRKMCGTEKDPSSGTLRMRTRTYAIETPEDLLTDGRHSSRKNLRSHFAVGFTKSKGAEGSDSKESIQDAFNSPLRPFVLASTSIGQEGLDFHYYCRRIMHWNLPGNPIDLEQREGRVNRFKCLAIRQSLADYYHSIGIEFEHDVWSEIFSHACSDLLQPGESELTPYWCLGANHTVKIERIVPMYPLSRDRERYERLIKILSLYRMTMGQARQEELMQSLLESLQDSELPDTIFRRLFINLSPFDHSKEGTSSSSVEGKC